MEKYDFDTDPKDMRNRLFVSMSAHFLTEQLPDEAIDWGEDQVEEFVDGHRWEPLEFWDSKEIVGLIESAAWHGYEFMKKEFG